MCCDFSDVGRRAGSPRAFGFCEKQTTQWSMHAHTTHTAQSDTVRALSSHAHKIESLYPAARGLIGGTHARPLSTNLSAHVTSSRSKSLIPYQCAPTTYTTLSHSSRLLVFPSSNSLLLHPFSAPLPALSLSCPHIPHYNTPAASRRVLTL